MFSLKLVAALIQSLFQKPHYVSWLEAVRVKDHGYQGHYLQQQYQVHTLWREGRRWKN